MIGGILDRIRRPRVQLDFAVAGDTYRVAQHAAGTFAVNLDRPTKGATAYVHVQGKGYVALGEAKSLDAAQSHCEAAASYLMSGRSLVTLTAYREGIGNRPVAVVPFRWPDGGMSLTLFGDAKQNLRFGVEDVRSFLAGATVVRKLGEKGMPVEDKGTVLQACLAVKGLFSPAEAFEGKWGCVRHQVRRGHISDVGREEVAADMAAVDTLRSYDKECLEGGLPSEDETAAAAAAASHVWDNHSVGRFLRGGETAGLLERLAEAHVDRIRTDLYHPFR